MTQTTRWKRNAVRGAAALALAASTAGAVAQEYPSRSIRLLIPFPPGGGTDIVSRVVGNKLAETLKWTIVLENRPGASGNIALELAAKSPPDGYTIVMGQSDNIMLDRLGERRLRHVRASRRSCSVGDAAAVVARQSRLAGPRPHRPGQDPLVRGPPPQRLARPPLRAAPARRVRLPQVPRKRRRR
jgi:hypothetical protein